MTDPSQQSVGATGASLSLAPQQVPAAAAVATATAPEASGADLAPVQHHLDELRARLDQLAESFASKLAFDQTKQQQIDFLYGEVRQAREGLFLQILRPIFLSLIALHDIIGKGYEAAAREAGGAEGTAARNYQSYQIEIEEILTRSGVNLYRSQLGAPFVRERHHAQGTQPTNDPARDKTIALSQRPGFEYQGKVLRPEWVVAYQYAASEQG